MASTPPPPPPPPPPPHHLEDGGPRYIVEPPSPEWHVIGLNVLNTVTQLAIGSVVFSVFFYINMFNWNQNDLPYKQHIYLCVFGYIILLTQSVLAYNPQTGWAQNLKYPQKRMAHWILQIIGSILAIAGSAIKLSDNQDNFQSAHGIMGLVAMILTILSLIGGVVNLLFSRMLNRVLMMTLQICVGCITLIIAYIAMCLGIDTVIRIGAGNINANLLITMTSFVLISTLLMTFINMRKWYSK